MTMTNQQKADTRKACIAAGESTRNMKGLELYNAAVRHGIVTRGSNAETAAPAAAPAPAPKKANSKLEEALRELMPEGELDESRVIDLIHQHSAAPKVVTLELVKQDGETKVIEGTHKFTADLMMNISCGICTMLVGPAASGKTTAAEKVAEALGLDFYFSGAVDKEHKLLGYMDANRQYHTTQFRKAFELGGVFLLDEVDGSNPKALLAAINAASANGICDFPDSDTPIKAHKDFVLIAAANTFGTGPSRQYVGRNQLDAATLDRFAMIDWSYDEALELHIALAEWDGAASWVQTVQAFRRKVEKLGLRHIVSPRASIMGAKLLKAGQSESKVKSMLLHKGLTADQLAQVTS